MQYLIQNTSRFPTFHQIWHWPYKGLRCFHQEVKGAVAWLTSMRFNSPFKSTENVIKAVSLLPRSPQICLYKKMTLEEFTKTGRNLIKLEKYL